MNSRLSEILVCLVFFCATADLELFAQAAAAAPFRTLRICVLVDQEGPVANQTMQDLVAAVSADYVPNVGIAMVISDYRAYFGPVDEKALVQELKNCKDSEIAVFFTDRIQVKMVKEKIRWWQWFYRFRQKDIRYQFTVYGWAYQSSPVIVMFQTEQRLHETDGPKWVLEHEIAHLFKVDHINDAEGFMVADADTLEGDDPVWTKKIIKAIKKHRNIRFGLP